jgi:cation:H+ antiporter
MLVAVFAFGAAIIDLKMSRLEGIALAVAMLVAAYMVVRWARADKADGLAVPDPVDEDAEKVKAGKEITFGFFSLGATLLGAEMLVKGGIELAAAFGVPEAFVGMTLVAVGTSLPELATSIAGIRRQEHNLVLGNVLGSNLFNALAVGGTASMIAPGSIDASFRVGSISMVICATLAGLLAFTGRQLVRWEGILLLLGFAAFVYVSYN